MADRKRVLVADDDVDLVDLLSMDLAHLGFEVLTASNGKEVLQILRDQKVDLVLLDVMMPYMDGYHVAFEISSKMGDASPKILLITSRDLTKEKGVALLSGAHDHLQKPFELDDLHRKVSELVGAADSKEPGKA